MGDIENGVSDVQAKTERPEESVTFKVGISAGIRNLTMSFIIGLDAAAVARKAR